MTPFVSFDCPVHGHRWSVVVARTATVPSSAICGVWPAFDARTGKSLPDGCAIPVYPQVVYADVSPAADLGTPAKDTP